MKYEKSLGELYEDLNQYQFPNMSSITLTAIHSDHRRHVYHFHFQNGYDKKYLVENTMESYRSWRVQSIFYKMRDLKNKSAEGVLSLSITIKEGKRNA